MYGFIWIFQLFEHTQIQLSSDKQGSTLYTYIYTYYCIAQNAGRAKLWQYPTTHVFGRENFGKLSDVL